MPKFDAQKAGLMLPDKLECSHKVRSPHSGKILFLGSYGCFHCTHNPTTSFSDFGQQFREGNIKCRLDHET